MEHSESIKEIAAAMCKFNAQVGKVKKDNVNPFFKSKYADLSSIIEVIRQPLIDNGLSYVQFPDGQHGMMTMLMHVSGEFIKGSFIMKPTKDDPQGLGSVITYQRRYALGSILGLNIDDDDDGNAASKIDYKFGNGDSLPWITDEQVKSMIAVVSTRKDYVIEALLKYKWSKKNKELITKSLNDGTK